MFKKVLVSYCLLLGLAFGLDLADFPRIDAVSAATKVTKKASKRGKVWVYKEFTGGSQCDERVYMPGEVKETRPEPVKEFETMEIKIYKSSSRGYDVCEASGCPEWSFGQYFKIKRSDLDKAQSLGYVEIKKMK